MSRSESMPEGRMSASVERLRHEFDHWLETAMTQGTRALDVLGLRSSDRSWAPEIDLVETGDSVIVSIDLPGVDPRSVDVSLTGNMLTIKGEKASSTPIDGQTLHTQERRCGPFRRNVALPTAVDADSVKAEGKEGVIQLRFSKLTPERSRQISIVVPEPAAPSNPTPAT